MARLRDALRKFGGRRQRLGAGATLAAVAVGVIAGASVVAIQEFVVWAQRLFLGFAAERRLAIPEHSSLLRIAVALVAGAILLTALGKLLARFEKRAPSDPIEANALRGGFLTAWDGVAVVLPILLRSAVGRRSGSRRP